MATGKTAITGLDADILADLVAGMTPLQSEGAMFMCHRTVFNVLRKLKTTYGEYIYSAPTEAGSPGTIWGYPIAINETMPNISVSAADTPFLFFGNPKHIYLGDRRRMTVAQSPHVGFAEDKLFVRVTERIGYAIAMPEALRILRTSAT
jgi:HK97 family phage major capsid protein